MWRILKSLSCCGWTLFLFPRTSASSHLMYLCKFFSLGSSSSKLPTEELCCCFFGVVADDVAGDAVAATAVVVYASAALITVAVVITGSTYGSSGVWAPFKFVGLRTIILGRGICQPDGIKGSLLVHSFSEVEQEDPVERLMVLPHSVTFWTLGTSQTSFSLDSHICLLLLLLLYMFMRTLLCVCPGNILRLRFCKLGLPPTFFSYLPLWLLNGIQYLCCW